MYIERGLIRHKKLSYKGYSLKKKKLLIGFILFIGLVLSSSLIQHFVDSGTPHHITVEGVPNFAQVSNNLYRSGQPTAEGMQQLEKMGIKTVINLRNFHSDADDLKSTQIREVNLPMTIFPPSEDKQQSFLDIVTDTTKTPVLVHCYAGSDRTGTMVAMYRIVVQGWSKEAALEEMTRGGYGFKWFLYSLKWWVRDLEVEKYETS